MSTYVNGEYAISTDTSRLDIEAIHNFLRRAHWCPGIPKEVVEKAVANSLCFGMYYGDTQIGFARVVTDYSRFAYLCDVFVLDAYRNKGLGEWLIECVVKCELLDGIRQILLGTSGGQKFYQRFGFESVPDASGWMTLKFDLPWYRSDLIESTRPSIGPTDAQAATNADCTPAS